VSGFVHVPGPGVAPPDRARVGGKAAALARLAAVRGPGGAAPEVPAWLALDTRAWEAFAAPVVAAAADAAAARAALLALPRPPELERELAAALAATGLAGGAVAVRSSAAAEDAAEASFAGQFESVLNVPAAPDGLALWDAIRRVWASTLSAHAGAYGGARGAAGTAMAVLVQAMVEPVAAGVAFDADPVTGARDTIVISAVWGLGESLVGGETDADTFRLGLVDGAWQVRERAVATQSHAVVSATDAGGTRRVALPAERASAPALTDAQAAAVAAWTRAVSQALGAPQDVEWALAGSPPRVVLLQARPITTLGTPLGATAGAKGPAAGAPAGAATHVGASVAASAAPGVAADPGAPAKLGPERRVWDDSNIIESYAGVTTPLTFTFARAVYEDVYRQFCALMGVPQPLLDSHSGVFANMLGLVRGRVYYQLLNWYRTLGLLPGFAFNRGFMERMMGVRERLEDPPPPAASGDRLRDLARLVAMVARMSSEAARLPREVPAFHARVARALDPLADQDLGRLTAGELAALYRRLEGELLAHWRAPLVNDFFAMMAFGVLGRLIERWLPDAPATLANDLLCGEGGIISTEPARAVMALARDAAADPGLRAALEGDDRAAWARLHAEHPAFAACLDAYVARFGDRCMNELKLETVTLREDPGFLLRMIRTYLAQGAADPDAARAREREIRAAAERRVRAALHGPRRAAFLWVLGRTRARVRDRENLRFERTRVFGVVRRIFLALGARLAEAGRIEAPRDVFFLTLEELIADAVGLGAAPGYAPRVAARRARFAAWAASPAPPDRFETRGPVADWLAHDPAEIAATRGGTGAADRADGAGGDAAHAAGAAAPVATELRGLGCCPGVVRGRVRVVHDPSHARDLAGRVLVAERTDPGWTLLFPALTGLLVQRGSLLSHSAIVAREMGIPCVVGIPGLLATLHDDDEVEMDGTLGTVRRTAPATPPVGGGVAGSAGIAATTPGTAAPAPPRAEPAP
jgi:rifampicin phosphotransferase